MNKRPKVGIGVLIFNKNNEILLGRRINSHGALTWAAPGGHLESGESFEECAQGEVEEETGLKVPLHSITFYAVTNDIFKKENKHYITIFMTASCPEEQIIHVCEPEKTLEWQWFSTDNLPSPLFVSLENLHNGKIYRK